MISHSQTMLLSIVPYLVTRLSMKHLAAAVTICRVLCEMSRSRTLNVKLCDCAHLSSFIFHTQSSILQSRRLLVFLSTINCDNTEQQCVEAHLHVHIRPDLHSKAVNTIIATTLLQQVEPSATQHAHNQWSLRF